MNIKSIFGKSSIDELLKYSIAGQSLQSIDSTLKDILKESQKGHVENKKEQPTSNDFGLKALIGGFLFTFRKDISVLLKGKAVSSPTKLSTAANPVQKPQNNFSLGNADALLLFGQGANSLVDALDKFANIKSNTVNRFSKTVISIIDSLKIAGNTKIADISKLPDTIGSLGRQLVLAWPFYKIISMGMNPNLKKKDLNDPTKVGGLVGNVGITIASLLNSLKVALGTDSDKMGMKPSDQTKAINALEGLSKSIWSLGLGLVVMAPFYLVGRFVAQFLIAPTISALLKSLTVYKDSKVSPTEISKSLGILGLSIISLGLSLFAWTRLFPGSFGAEGLMVALSVSATIIALSAPFILISMLDKKGTFTDSVQGSVLIGLSIVTLGLGILVWRLIKPSVADVLGIALTVGVLGLTFSLIGLVSTQITQGAMSIGVIGVGLAVLTLGILVTYLIPPDFSPIKIITTIAGLAAAFVLVGLASPLLIPGALAIGVIGASLLFLTFGILSTYLIPKDFKVDKINTIINGLTSTFVNAGLNSLLIIPGAASVLVMGASLIILSFGLLIFSVAAWLGSKIMGGIGSYDIKSRQGKGLLGAIGGVITTLGDSFSAVGWQSPMIILGAAAMLITGISLVVLSLGLMIFASALKGLDPKGFATSLQTVIGSIVSAFTFQYMTDDKGNLVKNGFGGVAGTILALTASVVQMLILASAFKSIAKGVNDLSTGFATAGVKDPQSAALFGVTISTLIGAIVKSFVDVLPQLKEAGEGLAGVSNIGTAVQGIAMGVNILASKELTADKLAVISSAISGLISSVIQGFASPAVLIDYAAAKKGIDATQNIGSSIKGLAEGISKFVNDKQIMDLLGLGKGKGPNNSNRLTEFISTLISSLSESFAKMGQGGFSLFGVSIVDSDIKKGIELTSNIASSLNPLIDAVIKIGREPIATLGAARKNVQHMMNTLLYVTNSKLLKGNVEENVKRLDSMVSVLSKLAALKDPLSSVAESVSKIALSTGKLLEPFKGIDAKTLTVFADWSKALESFAHLESTSLSGIQKESNKFFDKATQVNVYQQEQPTKVIKEEKVVVEKTSNNNSELLESLNRLTEAISMLVNQNTSSSSAIIAELKGLPNKTATQLSAITMKVKNTY